MIEDDLTFLIEELRDSKRHFSTAFDERIAAKVADVLEQAKSEPIDPGRVRVLVDIARALVNEFLVIN